MPLNIVKWQGKCKKRRTAYAVHPAHLRFLFECLHQLQLFLPAQVLDLPLPGHGGLLGGAFLPPHQLHRQTGAGILGPLAAVVGLEPLLQIGGVTAIPRAVGAPDQIGKTQTAPLLFR